MTTIYRAKRTHYNDINNNNNTVFNAPTQVVAVATYCAILVPRAHLLAEAMTQGMFMASMYQLFCLFMAYCGGEANLIASVKPQSLDMQVPPCCCWPCCCFLPKFTLTKYKLKFNIM